MHARAILIEMVARMNGWNNGAIAISQRELVEALGCHNRKVIAGMAELMQHGMIDVSAQGKWKERQAREYRLTFVSTKSAPATNEYLRWTPSPAKSGGATLASRDGQSDATVAPASKSLGATVASRIAETRRKTSNPQIEPDATVAPLIDSHTRAAEVGRNIIPPANAVACARCGSRMDAWYGGSMGHKRFCSQACRKSAESARRREKLKLSAQAATKPASIMNVARGRSAI